MGDDGESAQPAGYFDEPSAPVGVEPALDEDTRPQRRADAPSVPLPPTRPIEENEAVAAPSAAHATGISGDADAFGARPSVEPGHWVHEPEYWGEETMIAMTGRYLVPRPKTRPLPPPQRFRPMARWKSMLALGALVLVTALACVGTVTLGKLTVEVFGSKPQATLTVPHTPQPTVSPTRAAHK